MVSEAPPRPYRMSDFALSSRTCGNSRACRKICYSVIGDQYIGAITGHRLPHAVGVYLLPDQTLPNGRLSGYRRPRSGTSMETESNAVDVGD